MNSASPTTAAIAPTAMPTTAPVDNPESLEPLAGWIGPGGAGDGGLIGGVVTVEGCAGNSVPVHAPRGREATLLMASAVTVACGSGHRR